MLLYYFSSILEIITIQPFFLQEKNLIYISRRQREKSDVTDIIFFSYCEALYRLFHVKILITSVYCYDYIQSYRTTL